MLRRLEKGSHDTDNRPFTIFMKNKFKLQNTFYSLLFSNHYLPNISSFNQIRKTISIPIEITNYAMLITSIMIQFLMVGHNAAVN